jgi:16S rRNA (cytosine1402-N4)-methyltransferase
MDNMTKSNSDIEQNKPHKRRVRYKGTHPRTYAEKYKEHNPDKYKDTIEKVISKGSTPAGMHISIMVEEILDFLEIQPGQKGLDATLGYGGHTNRMLEKLEGKGHVYGLDIDPIEIEKTKKRLSDRGFGSELFTAVNINFKDIDKVAEEYGPFDFILADLGVSSMQIDNPERGFTYKYDGPLDLRLNPNQGVSAAERLNRISLEELEGMLIENSDEPYAYEIAKKVIEERRRKKIETTLELKNVVEKAVSQSKETRNMSNNDKEELMKKCCARVFQALRIDVNNEFEVLYEFLEKLPDVLAPGGRVAVLTFHSGEDRLVKKSFKSLKNEGVYSEVAREVIRPGREECIRNPRAKSTKMRWAVKSIL